MIVNAFAAIGGVSKVLVPDNLKAGITKPSRYEPGINQTYQDLADHYGCVVLPARVMKPRDKAKAEVAVQIVQRFVLARLRNRRFFSLAELNSAIRDCVTAIDAKVERQRTRVFTELQSHYLFDDRFGRPGKGNDKGKVEGLVGYARRNFLVPIPVFESFEALNAHLLECCHRRMADCLRGHDETIGDRLERDLAAFQMPLPAPYDACEKVGTTVSSLSLVRYRLNDYSVPTTYGHRDVLVRGYVHEVVISCGADVIARHPRSYEREDFVFEPLHYLALIEQKISALDQAAPLAGCPAADAWGCAAKRLAAAANARASPA